MVSRMATAPGRADAERAAAALVDAGVARVVLFGSVARGDATERSDIDLLAIYDDLDYTTRWDRRCELKPLAESAAGYPVDVVVTDRPEWRVRTTQVHTSFENRAAREGVVLVDHPAANVDWDKEMVMPADDYQEALYRLDLTARALEELYGRLTPSSLEQIARRMDDEARASGRYLVRLQRGCGDAHAVVEASVKALIHLGAEAERPAWGHDIAELCNQLVEPHRRAVLALLEPNGPEAIAPWHVLARYHREGRDPQATPELLTGLARTACRVASYAADQFSDSHATVETIRADISYVEDYIDGYDLTSGERLAGTEGGKAPDSTSDI